MDCVYIFKGTESEELRYSIRSVVKHLPHSNIWVVGDKPEWYSGNHIQTIQNDTKYNNARNNLLAACDSSEISDSFILMNDDFFVMKPVEELKLYDGGSLNDKINNYHDAFGNNAYTSMLRETRNQLQKNKIKNPTNYELHIPMIIDKHNLRKALNMPGVLWRSYCGNMSQKPSETAQDVKIYSRVYTSIPQFDYLNSEFPYLSTDDSTFLRIKKNLLFNLFKDKTKYESD